jgi:hypothetical protein
MLVAAARNECGTNRETANCGRIQVLTRSGGSAINGGNLPLRPDGGVVTQRTANPMPPAENRHSSRPSPSVPPINFQGLRRSTANPQKPIEAGTAKTPKSGLVHESGGRVSDLPNPPLKDAGKE